MAREVRRETCWGGRMSMETYRTRGHEAKNLEVCAR